MKLKKTCPRCENVDAIFCGESIVWNGDDVKKVPRFRCNHCNHKFVEK